MLSQKHVLGPIALSLSGGGYRAAAFHLGTLEMLHELGLLDDVVALSTVSGGSITGVAYAAARADNSQFEDFRGRLYNFLNQTNVITTALSDLENHALINGHDSMPSLIRSAAKVYASETLLGVRSLDSLRSSSSPLNDVVINATDFHTGNSFRFQTSGNPDVRSGNNNSKIPPDVNRMIRAADAVAASACFPSGFEPLRFPGDFQWPVDFDINKVHEVLGADFSIEIPLMDGGIFDNQGTDSVKNICDRKGAEIGAYIISDTSQRSGNLLDSTNKERRGKITIRLWYFLLLLLAIGSVGTVVATAGDFISTYNAGQFDLYRLIVSQIIPFGLSATVFTIVLYGRYRFRQAAADIESRTGIKLWNSIKGLTIPELAELINARARSLIVMSSSVFMKHLRNLAFTSLFADPRMHSKLIPNLIYDLDNESRWGREVITAGLQPSDSLRLLSRKAESYETNLWFLNESDLKDLIACGRATICFKILKYLLIQHSSEINDPDSSKYELFRVALDRWKRLNEQ
jgi:predicted acylesterase/phospholipase RssA